MTYLQGDSSGFMANKNTSSNNNNVEIQLTSADSTGTQYNGFFYSSRIQDLTSFTLSFEIYSSAPCYQGGNGCRISGNMIFFIGASEPVLWRDKSGIFSNGNDDSVTSYLFNFETTPFSYYSFSFPAGLTLLDSNLNVIEMAVEQENLNIYNLIPLPDSIEWIAAESWTTVEISYNRGNDTTWVVTIDNGNGPVILIDYSDPQNEAWIAQSGSLFGITAASFVSDRWGDSYGSQDFQVRNFHFTKLGDLTCVSNGDCVEGNSFCSGGRCLLIPCSSGNGSHGRSGFCQCNSGFYGNVIYGNHSLTGCEPCPLNSWSAAGTNQSCSLVSCSSAGYIGSAGHCECDSNSYAGNVSYVSGQLSGCELIPCSSDNGYVGPSGFCECDSGYYGNVTFDNHSITGCKPCPLNAWSAGGVNQISCSLVSCSSIGYTGNAGHCECDSNYSGNISYVSGQLYGCNLIPCVSEDGYYGPAGFCQCAPGYYGNVSYDNHSLTGCKPCPLNESSFAGNNTSIESCSYEAFVFESLSNSNDAQKVAMHTIARLANGTALASYVSTTTSPCDWFNIFSCQVINNQSFVSSVGVINSNSIVSLKLNVDVSLFDNLKFLLYLTIIILSAYNLSGTLPPSWSSLVHLQDLRVDTNNVEGTLPPSWSSLVNLNFLSLNNNNLDGILPPSWSSLVDLEHLDLQSNNLEGTVPPSWSSLFSLNTFYLNDNCLLSDVFPFATPVFSNWVLGNQGGSNCGSKARQLSLIEMNSNEEVIKERDDRKLIATNFLDLQVYRTFGPRSNYFNNLGGTLSPSWSSLVNLEYLYLNNNNLDGNLPPSWSSLVNLQQLYLNNNNLDGSLPPSWSSLVNLNLLFLNNNNLYGNFSIWNALIMNNYNNNGYFSMANNFIFFDVPIEYIIAQSDWFPQKLLGDYEAIQSISSNIPSLLWNSISNVCLLSGISCTAINGGQYSVIQEINLSNKNLNTSLSTFQVLNGIKYLANLDLSGNRLTGNLIDFTGFQSLIELNLRDNLISGGFSSSPFPPQIQVINLGGNKLTGQISFKNTEEYSFTNIQFMNLSSNSFSTISDTFNVSSSSGTIITILDNSITTSSESIVALPITCPFPTVNGALFLHDLCKSDLSLLIYFGIAVGLVFVFFLITLFIIRNIRDHAKRWSLLFTAYSSVIQTIKILVFGFLLYYDVYVDVCMYSYMLLFITSDKLNVARTCQLLNTSNLMLYLTPSVGNLTLDVIADLKLLALDPMLNENLMTNETSSFIPKVLAVTDIFKNPSIAMEFNNVANQTCFQQKCVFDYSSGTCSAPLVYTHLLFQYLVFASISVVILKELICSFATLYFSFFTPLVPEAFRPFVMGSFTFPFLLIRKGRDWFGKEIIDFVPRKRDRVNNLLFNSLLIDMNQLAMNTWFIVFISQSGITGVSVVVIPLNIAKVAFSVLQLIRLSCIRKKLSETNNLVTVSSTLSSSRVITVQPESAEVEMK